MVYINARENRRGNEEWTTQRHWQQWVHKTHDEDKQRKNTTQKTKQHGLHKNPGMDTGVREG